MASSRPRDSLEEATERKLSLSVDTGTVNKWNDSLTFNFFYTKENLPERNLCKTSGWNIAWYQIIQIFFFHTMFFQDVGDHVSPLFHFIIWELLWRFGKESGVIASSTVLNLERFFTFDLLPHKAYESKLTYYLIHSWEKEEKTDKCLSQG